MYKWTSNIPNSWLYLQRPALVYGSLSLANSCVVFRGIFFNNVKLSVLSIKKKKKKPVSYGNNESCRHTLIYCEKNYKQRLVIYFTRTRYTCSFFTFISSQTRISTNGAFMLGIWQRIQKWKEKKKHDQAQTFLWQGT